MRLRSFLPSRASRRCDRSSGIRGALVVFAWLLGVAPTAAADSDSRRPQPPQLRGGGPPLSSHARVTVPHLLPGVGAAASASHPGKWLVGARPGPRADALAGRYGAEKLSPRGIYRVDRRRARPLADALRAAGVYRFAEPNRKVRRTQAPAGGDDVAATDWRYAINPPAALAPPPGNVPLTAVIDDAADTTHPDLAGVRSARVTAFTDWHGTAVASLIAANANGFGMIGVYPGAPVLSIGTTLTTGDIARSIAYAVESGARIINLSLGGDYSYAVELEIAYAVSQGRLPVAAAGNDRDTVLPDGTANPVNYPAALPHVLSVASMGASGASSQFSTSNGAVDVSAPGERVLAAVPTWLDRDGFADGYMRVDGTSFASPIVAGAAAWLIAARPGLHPAQAADLLRYTARNIGPAGWDEDSGYGVIDLRAALDAGTPDLDPMEVNDDIPWVNGTRFLRPDPPLFRRSHRRRSVDAQVDWWKDPVDVYRLQLPPRRRLLITVGTLRWADPDLEIFSARARTAYRRRGLIGFSRRAAGKSDRVIVPAARRSRIVYAVVYHPGEDADNYNAPYRLTVKRIRR